MERINKIGLETISLEDSTRFPQKLIWSHDWVREWIETFSRQSVTLCQCESSRLSACRLSFIHSFLSICLSDYLSVSRLNVSMIVLLSSFYSLALSFLFLFKFFLILRLIRSSLADQIVFKCCLHSEWNYSVHLLKKRGHKLGRERRTHAQRVKGTRLYLVLSIFFLLGLSRELLFSQPRKDLSDIPLV